MRASCAVWGVAALAFAFVVAPRPSTAQVSVPTHNVDPMSDYADDYLATYSIIALDRATGQLGMGVQSKAFGAGNRAMTAKAVSYTHLTLPTNREA